MEDKQDRKNNNSLETEIGVNVIHSDSPEPIKVDEEEVEQPHKTFHKDELEVLKEKVDILWERFKNDLELEDLSRVLDKEIKVQERNGSRGIKTKN